MHLPDATMIQDIQTTDARLLEAWKLRQDREALAMLIERYANLIMGVCCRQCRQRSDAEDAFQITLLILARSSHSIRSATTLPAWLHTTAMRVACRIRNQREAGTIEEETLPAERTDFLQQLSQRHELQILDEELHRLDEGTRLPILLHYIEGKKVVDIAEEMDITPRAVRGKLQRGRQELQRRLILRGVSAGAVLAVLNQSDWASMATVSAQEAVCRIHTHPENFSPRPTSDPTSVDGTFFSSQTPNLMHQGILMKSLYWAITGSMALALFAYREDEPQAQGPSSDQAFVIASLPETNTPPVAFQTAGDSDPNATQVQPPQSSSSSLGNSALGNSDPSSKPNDQSPGGFGMGASGATGIMRGEAMGPGFPGAGFPGMGGFGVGTNGAAASQSGDERAYSENEENYILETLHVTLEPDQIFSANNLTEFAETLQSKLGGIPVVLNVPEGLEGVDLTKPISISEGFVGSITTEMAIRQALRPCNLRILVSDDAIQIVPDSVALAMKGIGIAKYTNVDDEAVRDFEMDLEEIEVEIKPEDTLRIADLAELGAGQIVIAINNRALEDMGMTLEEPLSLPSGTYTLQRLFERMRREWDLDIRPHSDHLELTTVEDTDNPTNQLTRIYWLDATGLDPSTASQTISTMCNPEDWEYSGGASRIYELKIPGPHRFGRYGIVVSTTWKNHRDIAKLLQSLREGNMAPYAQQPWDQESGNGMGGGMVMPGMGGIMGGGMGGGVM